MLVLAYRSLRLRSYVPSLAAIVFGVAVCSTAGVSRAQALLSPALATEASLTPAGEYIRAYAVLREQASGTEVRKRALARRAGRTERATAVLAHLRDANAAAQAGLVGALGARADVRAVKPHWLVNLVGFEATPQALAEIAAHPDVLALNLDLPWVAEGTAETAPAVATAPGGTEVGLRAIGAPGMWARGYTGFGGVALVADTGVDPYHPALNHKYAGHDGRPAPWFASDDYPDAADCGDHGTHVAGTVLGLDAVTGDTIGVAPGAHWLGAAILCGTGTGDNVGVFEWALDPDPDDGTVADRPFVINNSWQDPSIEDVQCTDANPYPILLDNLAAAGVAVVFSAGNAGPEPRTITPPHSYNASLLNAFTVGALSGGRSGFPIADFSSRGPATCSAAGDEAIDIKPEVSAPGVDVRSCVPFGEYGLKSGTSMAAPHTAGAVLLLHEAFPELDGEAILAALYYSARDLGAPGEDNTYGRGIIDVDSAYAYLVAAGNEPAPPARPAAAVEVVAAASPPNVCTGTLTFAVDLRNTGAVAAPSIEYEVAGLTAAPVSGTLRLGLAPGADTTVSVPVAYDVTGATDFRFRVTAIGGEPADPGLDLGATLRTTLTRATPPTLTFARDPATLCLGSPVTLTLESDIDDPTLVYFSDDPEPGLVPLDAAATFTLASLDTAVELYGQNEYRRRGGIPVPAEPDALAYSLVDTMRVYFTAEREAVLRQVSFLQETAGRVRVEIIREADDEVIGRYFRRGDAGQVDVPLFAELGAGERYRAVVSTRVPLATAPARSIREAPVTDLIRFERVEADDRAAANGSSSLFDWVAGYYDGCALTPVRLTPDTTRRASVREVGVGTATPVAGEPFEAYDATAPTGEAYAWTLDGRPAAVSGNRIRLTPQRPGEQEVRMSLLDEGGCATAAATTVAVTEGSSAAAPDPLAEGELRLWPNPATRAFSIAGGDGEIARVSVLDAAGRVVADYAQPQPRYAVGHLANGSYVVRVVGRGGFSTGYGLEIQR